jgi:ferredoxin
MPKVLAQIETIEWVGTLAFAESLEEKPLVRAAPGKGEEKRLVVRHRGANLRRILQQNGIDLYNGGAKVINCRGIGSCGTCAVHIEGEVSPVNWRDQARRSLPPHSPTSNLRLARQTEVWRDVKVTKFDGFWKVLK